MKIALFPGSFDPFTNGHHSILTRALPLFDKIIVGIGVNADKSGFIDADKRVKLIEDLFKDKNKVKVQQYTGLTINFCKQINANFIIRGLRTASDFEYERAVGQTNKLLDENIETVFFLTLPEHTFISSSIVRDVYKNNGDISQLVPKGYKF